MELFQYRNIFWLLLGYSVDYSPYRLICTSAAINYNRYLEVVEQKCC
jgi:hypothetical protein